MADPKKFFDSPLNKVGTPSVLGRRQSRSFEERNKYDHGLHRRTPSQYDLRAENMNNWQAFGNAAVQAIGEVGLGTMEGFGYLLDFKQHADTIKGTEREYANWFSDLMKAGKEHLREEFPVYGGDGFEPLDPRFWAKNLPSIATGLSLLIPVAGTMRLIAGAGQMMSRLGRGTQLLNAANKVMNTGNKYMNMKGVTGALMSRYMENTMEASQVMEAEYHKALQAGASDEDARNIAGKAASNTFKANWVNAIPDIFQYSLLMKGAGTRVLDRAATDARRGFGKRAMAATGNLLGVAAPEALEEGIQYGIGQESPNAQGGMGTLQKVFQNFPEYFKDDEFKTSMLMGAAGGAMFHTVGQAMKNKIDAIQLYDSHARRNEMPEARKVQEREAIKMAKEGKIEDARQLIEKHEDPKVKQRVTLAFDNYEVVEGSLEGDQFKAPKVDATMEALSAETTAKEIAEEIDPQHTEEFNQLVLAEAKKKKLDENSVFFKNMKAVEGSTKVEPNASTPMLKKAAERYVEQARQGENAMTLRAELEVNPQEAIVKKAKEEKNQKRKKISDKLAEIKDRFKDADMPIVQKAKEVLSNQVQYLKTQLSSTDKETTAQVNEKLKALAKEDVKNVPDPLNYDTEEEFVAAINEYAPAVAGYAPIMNEAMNYYRREHKESPSAFNIPEGQTFTRRTKKQNIFYESMGVETKDGISRAKMKVSRFDAKTGEPLGEPTVITMDRSAWEAANAEEVQSAKPETDRTIGSLDVLGQTQEETDLGTLQLGEEQAGTQLEEDVDFGPLNFGQDNAAESGNEMIEEPEIVEDTESESEIVSGIDEREASAEKARRDNQALTMEDNKGFYVWVHDMIFAGTNPRIDKETGEPIPYIEKRGTGGDFAQYMDSPNYADRDETIAIIRNLAENIPDWQNASITFEADPWTINTKTNFSRKFPSILKTDDGWKNIQVLVVVRHNGKAHPIGMLKSMNRYNDPKKIPQGMADLRQELFQKLKDNTDGKPVRADSTTRITDAMKGRYWMRKTKHDLDASKYGINGKLYLGVGMPEGAIITNDIPQEIRDNMVESTEIKKGRAYVLRPDTLGRYRWTRAFTKRLKDVEGAKQRVLDILGKAQKAHEEIIASGITEEQAIALSNKKRSEVPKDQKAIFDWYNGWKGNKSELQSIIRFKSAGKVDPDFRENLWSIKGYWTDGVFDPQKFYDHLKLDERPVQIAASKVNTGSYNDQIANRLYSNLNPRTSFHSPTFFVDFYRKSEAVRPLPDPETFTDKVDKAIPDSKPTEHGVSVEYGKHGLVATVKDKKGKNTSVYYDYRSDKDMVYKIEGSKIGPPKNIDKVLLSEIPTEVLEAILKHKKGKVVPDGDVVEVENFKITVTPEGKMFYKSGGEVTDETTINKVLVKQQYNKDRIVEQGSNKYFVLNDNRIISLQKTSKGKEVFKTGPQRSRLLTQIAPVDKPVKKKRKGGGIKPGEIKYKKADKPATERINLDKAKSWLQQRLPKDIAIDVHKGLIATKGDAVAWGYATNRLVVLSDAAQAGTEYHEAFHVVVNNLMTSEQRAELFEAARKQYGDNLTLIELEERLADDFMDYVMTKDAPKGIIAQFFQWLRNLITGVKSHGSQIKNLFHSIERGEYADARVMDNNYLRWSRDSEMTTAQQREVVYTGLNLLDAALEKIEGATVNERYKKALTGKDDTDRILSIEDGYDSVLNYLLYYYGESETINKDDFLRIARSIRRDIVDVVESDEGFVFEINENVTEKKGIGYYQMIRAMSSRGFAVKLDSGRIDKEIGPAQDEQDMEVELDDTGEFREQWSVMEFSISPKDNMTSRLQRWMNQIRKVDDAGNPVMDSFGLGIPQTYNSSEVYPLMQRELGGSIDIAHMMEKSENAWKVDPFFKQVSAAFSDVNRATDVFIHIAQKVHPSFRTILMDYFDGKMRVRAMNSNAFTTTKNVLNTLYSGFNFDKDLGKYATAFDKYLTRAKSSRRFESSDLDAIKKGLSDLNMSIPEAVIDRMNEDGKFYFAVQKMRQALPKVSSEDFSAMKPVAQDLGKYFPEEYQKAHYSVEGKKVYEWINSNYIARLLNKFNARYQDTASFFKQDKLYENLPILNEQQNFQFIVTDGIKRPGAYKGKKYNSYSDTDMFITLLSYFHNNNNSREAIYPLPILSDAPALAGVTMRKYAMENTFADKYDDNGQLVEKSVLSMLVDIAKAEYERTQRNTGKGIKNYDKHKKGARKSKFTIFSGMPEMTSWDESVARTYISELIEDEMHDIRTKLVNLGIISQKQNGSFNVEMLDSRITNINEFLNSYVANHMLAHSQLMLIGTGDPSFYKDSGDYYKRAKELWSPGLYINPANTYTDIEGKVHSIPKGFMDLKVLNDIVAPVDPDTLAAMPEKHRENYQAVNLTDGQTIIDPVSYRYREIGLNRWNHDKERQWKMLMEGKLPRALDKNARTDFNPFKPYYYDLHAEDGLIVPLQKKDSELMIHPFYGLKTVNGKKNPLYNPLWKQMLQDFGFVYSGENVTFNPEKRTVDVIAFDSTIKVGLNSETATDVVDGSISGLKDQKARKLHYNNWRLQQETPQHHFDTDDIFGTQIMKLIISDIDPEAEYINPRTEKPISGKDLVEEYNNWLVEDIVNSYEELAETFGKAAEARRPGNKGAKRDYERLIDMIKEQVINQGLGEQFVEGLEVTYNDVIGHMTKLPLWHPLHSYRVESMLNSMWRKKVTRRRFKKGYSFVNASPAGFERMPKIKFGKDGGIDHIQVYAPIHDRRLLKYVNEDGFIDEGGMDRIRNSKDKVLLDGITYRIPNEDKYSDFNIKIIGFLPTDEGVIFMPPEMTTISGFDFDIDKVRGFFYDVIPTFEEFAEDNVEGKAIIERFDRQIRYVEEFGMDENGETIPEDQREAKVAELQNEKMIALKALIPQEEYNSAVRQLRSDNEKIDLMRAVLQNPATVDAFLTPGGFDIIENHNEHILEQNEIAAKKGDQDLIESNIHHLRPSTLVEIAGRMNAGKALIGIAANHNAVHALWQHAGDLRLAYAIEYNGELLDDLTRVYEVGKGNISDFNREVSLIKEERREDVGAIYIPSEKLESNVNWYDDKAKLVKLIAEKYNLSITNKDAKDIVLGKNPLTDISNQRISRNFSENLAAFVDNGKNPQASKYNMNVYTADVLFTLLHVGVPLTDAMNFIAQPAIRHFTQRYFNAGGDFNAEKMLLEKMQLNNLKISSQVEGLDSQKLEEGLSANHEDPEQTLMLATFVVYKKISNKLTQFQRASKIGDAGPGVTQAQNIEKIRAVDYADFEKAISGATTFLEKRNFMNTFYKYGIKKANEQIIAAMGLPNLQAEGFQRNILDKFEAFKGNNLRADEIESVYRSMMDYLATFTDFFKISKETIDRVEKYVAELSPEETNPFLRRLQAVENGRVEFRAVTGIDNGEMDILRSAWKELFDVNPDLAKDLVKYAFWMNGFQFGPRGFSHLQPIDVYTDNRYIPDFNVEYSRLISEMLPDQIERFLNQYIRNNFRKTSAVPVVDGENATSFGKVLVGKPNDLMMYSVQTSEGKTLKYWKPYIKVETKKAGYKLYEMDVSSPGVYLPAQELGLQDGRKTRFQEYDYNSPELDSIFNAKPEIDPKHLLAARKENEARKKKKLSRPDDAQDQLDNCIIT